MNKLETVSITLQDRIFPDEDESAFLDTYMANYQGLKRILFSCLYGKQRPTNLNEFKREFIKDHGITSTYYNSLKNECDGIFKSQIELQKHYRDEYLAKKQSLEDWIRHKTSVVEKSELGLEREQITEQHRKKLQKKIDLTKFKLHQKKRRLADVNRRLDNFEDRLAEGKDYRPKIVFGSKALLKKRHYLDENEYDSALDWKEDWQFAREKSAFFLGDSTEVHRNRQIKGILHILEQDQIDLALSVPYSMRESYEGLKSFTLKDISLSNRTLEALKECLEASYIKEVRSKDGSEVNFKECRFPISYRIKKEKFNKILLGKPVEEIRYYLQTIIQVPKQVSSSNHAGAIGIDLNVDHLAVAITDRFGNPQNCFSLAFRPYEGRSDQNEAALGAIIHDLCDIAEKNNLPIVIEKLSLSFLMAKLKNQYYGKTSQKLSSLSYDKFFSLCESICARRKVSLIQVFAGYSSQIGAINYINQNDQITSHEAAAIVIARRGQKKKEGLNISNLESAPGGQEILSQSQERLAGPAIKVLKKYSKKLDFRAIKSSYLQFSPERQGGPELGIKRCHVFNPRTQFRSSA